MCDSVYQLVFIAVVIENLYQPACHVTYSDVKSYILFRNENLAIFHVYNIQTRQV